MPGHTGEERDGALLRRLKAAGQAAKPARLGFSTGESGPTQRKVLVVARLAASAALASQLAALAEAGVDAVEISVRTAAEVEALPSQVAESKLPWGLYIAEGIAGVNLPEEGPDFVHLAAAAPAHLLAGKTATRLISLSPETPPGRLPGVNGLKAEVTVVERPEGTTGEGLTLDALLAVRTIQAASQIPVLVGPGLGLTPQDAAVLQQHGIEGVLVEGTPAVVSAFIEAIDAL